MECQTEVQKRYGIRLEFEMRAERLRYAICDFSGAREFHISYETFLMEPFPTLTISNIAFFRRLALIPLGLFVASIATINNTPLSEALAFAALATVVALIAARLLSIFAVSFTLLPTSAPPQGSEGHTARVIRDSRHDRIVDELKSRWRARLRSLYGQINLENDPAKELAKFKWLKDCGAISDVEFTGITGQLNVKEDDGREPGTGAVH